MQSTMQPPPPGGLSGAESPPHRPAASASLSAYTALTPIAVLSQNLWEVPLARAAPQTRHRHECSGAPTGGRRHPHRPLLPTHPTPQFCFVAPQTTAYHPRVYKQRYAGPAPSTCTDCSTGSAGGRRGWRRRRWRHPSRRPSSGPLHLLRCFPISHNASEHLGRAAAPLQPHLGGRRRS